jgi:hypothetical protein
MGTGSVPELKRWGVALSTPTHPPGSFMACYRAYVNFFLPQIQREVGIAGLQLNERLGKYTCKMTNVIYKFLIYLSIYFCLTCFVLSFCPSSEAGVQLRQLFKSPG